MMQGDNWTGRKFLCKTDLYASLELRKVLRYTIHMYENQGIKKQNKTNSDIQEATFKST